MSTDEQDRIRGRNIRLRNEKEEELKMLRCKMREVGQRLTALGRGLEGKCGIRAHQETGGFIVRSQYDPDQIITEYPTQDELIHMLLDMERLSEEIQQLERDLS